MNKTVSRLKAFFEGRLYPIAAAILILAGHMTGTELWLGCAVLLSVAVGCFVSTDARFLLVPTTCILFAVSTGDYTPNHPGYEKYDTPLTVTLTLILTVLALASIGFFLWKNRKSAEILSRKSFLSGLLVLTGVMTLNGVGNPSYSFANALFGFFVFGFCILGVYCLFSLHLHGEEGIGAIFFALTVAGVLICAELIGAYATTVRIAEGEIVKESVVLGWGVWTSVGGMLAFLMPAPFVYAAERKNGWLYYLLGVLDFFCILLTQSRGALLVGAGVLALCVGTVCFTGRQKNRIQNRLLTAALAVLALCGVILFREKLLSLVENFLQYGFDDNGRREKWLAGWRIFKSQPIFGGGFYGYAVDDGWPMGIFPSFCHNTLIQVASCAGIWGIGAYLYHRFDTLRRVFRKPNYRKSILFYSLLGLLLCSLIDVLFFKGYPDLFYAVVLVGIEKCDRSGRGDEPLCG